MSTPEQRAAIIAAATRWYFARRAIDKLAADSEQGKYDQITLGNRGKSVYDEFSDACKAIESAVEATLPDLPDHPGTCNCERCNNAYGPRRVTITDHPGMPYPKHSVGASRDLCWDCNAALRQHETIDTLA